MAGFLPIPVSGDQIPPSWLHPFLPRRPDGHGQLRRRAISIPRLPRGAVRIEASHFPQDEGAQRKVPAEALLGRANTRFGDEPPQTAVSCAGGVQLSSARSPLLYRG